MTNINRTLLLALTLCGMTTVACGDDSGGEGGGGEGNGAAGDSCSVVDNGDGTGTIECGDGSTATITGIPGDTGEDCAAEDNGDGTWTLTCGDSDPVVVQQEAMFETKVLVREGSDLWLVVFNGSGGGAVRHRINKPFINGGSINYVEVSSDNAHVLYVAQDDDVEATPGQVQVYVSDISGDEPTTSQRVNGSLVAAGGVLLAHFSPDGGKIGYIADQAVAGTSELYVAEVAGGEPSTPEKVSGTTTAGRDVEDFVFSADGAQIAFRSDTLAVGIEQLYVASADGSADPLRVNGDLTAATIVSAQYGFSPNGERLAYTANDLAAPSLTELFVAVVNGNEAEAARKVNGTLDGLSVVATNWSFSPDSNKLAYLADQDPALTTNLNLYIADVSDDTPADGVKVDDGGEGVSVQAGFAFVTSSDYLVYRSTETTATDMELFSVDVSGTAPGTPVTLSPSLVEGGTVSSLTVVPGTDNVVFTGAIRGPARTEIYFVPASGDAGDAVLVNHTLPSDISASLFGIARNGTALTYVTPLYGGGATAHRVMLTEDGPEAPELVSVPTFQGRPFTASAYPSNTGAFVGLYDSYAGVGVTDGIAAPAHVSTTNGQLWFLD